MRRSSSSLVTLPKLLTTSSCALILFLLIASFLCPSSAFAQASSQRMRSASAGEKDRDQPEKRAEWNRRGREAPKGESAAALRLRAYQHKMVMRAQRAAA